MRTLSLKDLELALALAFNMVDFSKVFVTSRSPTQVVFGPKAVRVGRFVIESERVWHDTLAGFVHATIGLTPHPTKVNDGRVITLLDGNRKQIMTIFEDPAT